MPKAVRYVIASQLSFFISIGICTALLPKFLLEINEGGISNFAVNQATRLPFTLAFSLCAGFFLQTARFLPSTTVLNRRLRIALRVLAGLLIFVLVSTYPYKINYFFDDLHELSFVLIFYFEIIISIWLSLGPLRNRLNIFFLAVQLTFSLLAILAVIGTEHLLFISQIGTSLAFGVILVRSIYEVSKLEDVEPLSAKINYSVPELD